MRYVIDIALAALGFAIGFLVVGPLLFQPPQVKPKVSPAYIPYCWAKDHGLYRPCMYNSKEYAA